MIDWGVGTYEDTAAELAPVAGRLVALAGVGSGERVLDIGCGTGNAALAAAAAGARVTGIDPARRLIDVASAAAGSRGFDASFVVGDARELPFGDASFDVALSNFGIIFAPEPDRSAAEMLRVLREGGRAAVSTWLPGNKLSSALEEFARGLPGAAPSAHPGFDWTDENAVRGLFEDMGATVSFEHGLLTMQARSAEDWMGRAEERHPVAITVRSALKRAGTYAETRRVVVERLEAANEDPNAFRVTSRYQAVLVRKPV